LERQVVDSKELQIEEVNGLLHAVEERIGALMIDLEKLDEFKDADAYHALEEQIRALNEQQRILAEHWKDLTAGYSTHS
jgi:hypothetical protein